MKWTPPHWSTALDGATSPKGFDEIMCWLKIVNATPGLLSWSCGVLPVGDRPKPRKK
jgi:hypothetical protein